jgi:hypothetical protein
MEEKTTNWKEGYTKIIKYLLNEVEDTDIFDNWMSYNLRELTELIEKLENESLKYDIGKIQSCKADIFHGIECLQMDKELGFFKSNADLRPAHAIWIDKEKAERLFSLFQGD